VTRVADGLSRWNGKKTQIEMWYNFKGERIGHQLLFDQSKMRNRVLTKTSKKVKRREEYEEGRSKDLGSRTFARSDLAFFFGQTTKSVAHLRFSLVHPDQLQHVS
jgi:hypothetical protein